MCGSSLKPGSCLKVVKAGRFCAKPDRDSANSKKVNAAFRTMVLLVTMLLRLCRMVVPSCGHHAAQAKSAQCTVGKLAINRESREGQVVSIESDCRLRCPRFPRGCRSRIQTFFPLCS